MHGCFSSHHPIFADQGICVKAFAADLANACRTTIGLVKKAGQKALPRKSMTRLALPVDRSIVLGLSSVTFTSI